MNQLYALGSIVVVGLFFNFLTNVPTIFDKSGSVRDAMYVVMKTDSNAVRKALEGAVRECLRTEYYTKAPQGFKELAVSAYLSTLSIPGVSKGEAPTDEAFREQMTKRINLSRKNWVKKSGNYSESEMEFFQAAMSFVKGNKAVDNCVFDKAGAELSEKGLVPEES